MANTYTDKIGDKLNQLLEKTYDAEKGFEQAAENTESALLKDYFTRKAEERYNFGHDLKSELSSYNQNIDKGGSVTGTLHRTWIDIKSLLSMDTEESILEEAIRGEKASLEDYKEILNDTHLPANTLKLLESQKSKIEFGLNKIKTLEDLA
ncbi:ferritin-like domain-containing protein [Wenyingzhuangia sp. IMCC45533]